MVEDRLVQIFNRQRELMEKYHPIEKSNGLLQTEDVPVDLDSRFGQARIKDFAWRFIEEIGEALYESGIFGITPEYKEELADALHFLTELTILSGYEPADLFDGYLFDDPMEEIFGSRFRMVDHSKLDNSLGQVVKAIAMMCNLLKNRPWKQSHTITPREEYLSRLREVWYQFGILTNRSGISTQELYELYFGKAEINKQRQDTGY